MKKMPTLFDRDETMPGKPIKNVVRAGCEWVLAGEGVATRKLDGQNVKVHDGVLYKRQKPVSGDYDEASYVPAERNNPSDRWLWEAFDLGDVPDDGIYECVGPKIQGNPERHERHVLIRVCPFGPGLALQGLADRTYGGLMDYLLARDMEGIVFHRDPGDPDCDKAKIKKRDFGMKR